MPYRFEDRRSEIIYKLKEKPVYFLLEHQSTIDKNMPLRIWEYIGEIMRRENRIQKVYPVVIPIIIYTGFKRWKLETNFKKLQYQARNYQNYQIDLAYNLIVLQDYSFEELLAKNTLFSSIMIMEKCKDKEELILQLDNIIEQMSDKKDLEAIAEIITNIIQNRIGKEETRKIKSKEPDEKIMKYTGITKEELEELKGEVIYS